MTTRTSTAAASDSTNLHYDQSPLAVAVRASKATPKADKADCGTLTDTWHEIVTVANAARASKVTPKADATATPAVKVSTDTRRTIRASVTAATALDKATGKFSKASAVALLTIVDELGVGKDAGTVWTDTVASYGENILKPASGRAYLSHVRKAIKIGKTTADVWDFLGLDGDKPKGLSSLGAWLKDEDKTTGLSDSDPETGDTDKASKPADISALMARAIKALEAVADVHKGGSILDAGQWQAFRTIAAGIERREVARIAPKVSAPKVSAPKVSVKA